MEPIPFAENVREIQYIETPGRAVGILPLDRPQRTRGSERKDITPTSLWKVQGIWSAVSLQLYRERIEDLGPILLFQGKAQ